MAAASARSPYHEIFDDILALAKRPPGWNSYDADEAVKDAIIGAVGFVNSFYKLSGIVPRPDIGLSPDGAVVLRWLLPEHEIEIEYRGFSSGDYSVIRRGSHEVVREGSLGELDPLKDIVGTFVVDRPPGR
jgi:hypothetical protein